MKILEKLEWNKITEEVQNNAITELGKELCFSMPILNDIEKIQIELNLTDEAKKLSDSMLLPPINSINNIEKIINEAKINRILTEAEILETIKCLKISRLINGFFSRNQDVAPNLSEIAVNLYENKEFEEKISDFFTEAGHLKPGNMQHCTGFPVPMS